MKTINREIKKLKVKVSYPDGKGGHITTVGEVREKWEKHGEHKDWIEKFMSELVNTGSAYSRFGKYELLG